MTELPLVAIEMASNLDHINPEVEGNKIYFSYSMRIATLEVVKEGIYQVEFARWNRRYEEFDDFETHEFDDHEIALRVIELFYAKSHSVESCIDIVKQNILQTRIKQWAEWALFFCDQCNCAYLKHEGKLIIQRVFDNIRITMNQIEFERHGKVWSLVHQWNKSYPNPHDFKVKNNSWFYKNELICE